MSTKIAPNECRCKHIKQLTIRPRVGKRARVGEQCRNERVEGSEFCKVHAGLWSPTPDPERRCVKIKRGNGQQCGRWRQPGSKFCRFHGGSNKKHKAALDHRRLGVMPRFYQKYVTKTLADSLDELLNQSPAEQLELFEELAMMRDMAAQISIIWGQIREKKLRYDAMSPEEKKKFDGDLYYVMQMHQEAMNQVKNMATAAASIYNTAKDKVPLGTLRYFTDQVTRCAHEAAKGAFGGDEEKSRLFAQAFNDLVKNSVRLPEFDSKGQMVTNTPSDDVDDMIASVPKVTDGE